MKVIGVHCPYCGGNVKFDLDSGKKHCFCVHCGQQIILDDEVVRSEHREVKVDEARIREAELKAKVQLKQIESKERNKRFATKLLISAVIINAVIILVTVAICNILINFFYYDSDWVWFIGGAILAIEATLLFCSITNLISPDNIRNRDGY